MMIDFKNKNILINKEVNTNLERIITNNMLTNGYIFYGPEGIGKKNTAFEFIKEIFKKYSSNSNIEEKIINNNHPDFLLIEPKYFIKGKLINHSETELSKKNHKDTIRIDQIRNIKIFLGQKSIESEKKIVLIVDAHLLNEAASNCLLKTLEEPTNGIFILLTSNLNLLLDTIISRCQLIRFKPFSYEELELFIKTNIDSTILDSHKNLNLEDLVNSANGSPGKIVNDIKILKEFPKEIKDILELPLRNNLEILKISKLITEYLEIHQQIFLINLIQNKWWIKTKNSNIIKKLEILKSHLNNYIQPRLAWEVTLLNIAHEDL